VSDEQRNLLSTLCVVVGDLAGTAPRCLDTAAVMLEAADVLGVDLRLVPVSLVIADPDLRGEMFMLVGQATVRARVAEGHDVSVPSVPGMTGEAGHVVVVSDEFNLVLDPSFRQVPERFADPVSIVLTVKDSRPESEVWQVPAPGRPDLELAYVIRERDLPEAQDLVDGARPGYRAMARSVAEHVRAVVAAGLHEDPPSLMVQSAFGPVPASLDHA
jgi:hypothetical protein